MRWLNDVSMDLRKMGLNEWRDRARNREAWRHIVEEAKAHPGLWRHREELVDSFENLSVCCKIIVGVSIIYHNPISHCTPRGMR